MVDELIGYGHSPVAIGTYSIKQMHAYSALGERRQDDERMSMVSLMRSAYHAENDSFKKLMRQLDGD